MHTEMCVLLHSQQNVSLVRVSCKVSKSGQERQYLFFSHYFHKELFLSRWKVILLKGE